jgi:hypothetical protein
MPVMNSGKLFNVRQVSGEKEMFSPFNSGKSYSGIGPAKRAITKNHTWAAKIAKTAKVWLECYSNGTLEATFGKQHGDLNARHDYYIKSLKNAWLNTDNFVIVEFAVTEKAIHKYKQAI